MARRSTTVTSAVIQAAIGRIKKTIPSGGFSRKYLLIGAAVVLIAVTAGIYQLAHRRSPSVAGATTSISVTVGKSYTFPAVTGQGQKTQATLSFVVKDAEKTDQVIVKDQTFVAKNNKMFLILNLELKNETTQPLNIVPGDLIRLSYNGDESNKYAPDLHNNLVLVAPISTKLDRVGFVIPKDVTDFNIYIGELEGKKELTPIHLSS